MCSCQAHLKLVDYTCNCDHADDRISQWKRRALIAEEQLAKLVTASDKLFEARYRVRRWFARTGQTFLFRVMPNWLVKQAMMRASRHILPDEVVPEVPFMVVFGRLFKKEESVSD